MILRITVVLAIFASGCIQASREQSQRARLLATSRAEAEEEKKLDAIRLEEEREINQAAQIAGDNPRAGCILRINAQHKACKARSEAFAKSFRSAWQRMANPKACDDVLSSMMPACEAMPAQANQGETR